MASERESIVVVPSDTEDLERIATSIYVGSAGNIALFLAKDDTQESARVLMNVSAGTVLKVSIKRIMATDTTASNIVAFFG